MVGSGMLKGLDVIFYTAILGVILSVIAVICGIWYGFNYFYGDKEIVSPYKITPELKLTITENKVDTLYIYKLKK